MEFDEWLKFGQDQGWIGPQWCYVHAAPDLTDEEQELVDAEDGDLDVICIHAVRFLP